MKINNNVEFKLSKDLVEYDSAIEFMKSTNHLTELACQKSQHSRQEIERWTGDVSAGPQEWKQILASGFSPEW